MTRIRQRGAARDLGGWPGIVGLLALVAILIAMPAHAQNEQLANHRTTPTRQYHRGVGIALQVSQGKLVVLRAPAKNVFVADPTIADVQVANADHIFVFGKKAGRTSLYALGADGVLLRAIAIDVSNPTVRAQAQTQETPGADGIHVGTTNNGLVLQGSAATPAAAALAARSAADNAPLKAPIDNRVQVRSSVQVTLRVRIAEVDRTISKELGINWNALGQYAAGGSAIKFGLGFTPGLPTGTIASATGGFAQNTGKFAGSSIDGVIDALAEEGLVTILAEPSLTVISGQPASFLAGGEFPIPVSQALGVTTIEFKSYGVSLNFIPTVMAPNDISIHVKPEVSQITDQGAITVSGLTIPALTVRRADTTIELGSGQSFAIAGLLQSNSSNDIQRFPGLGDLPVLGPLFRSTSFQHNESELIIVVTPYIVRPIDNPSSIRLPTDAWRPATDMERVLFGEIQGTPHNAANPGGAHAPHLLGAAGFEVE
ncbi:MAG: type II and III secretion system protein family protein [Stellaceae bacterium]